MSAPLSPAVSKLAAFGLLIALALGIYGFIVVPLQTRHHVLDDAIVLVGDTLDRLKRQGARKTALSAKLKELDAAATQTRGLLIGTTENLVGAELQATLKKIVATSGGNLKSVQPLKPKQTADLRKVAVRATVEGDIGVIQSVLYSLETRDPILFVDNLSIQSRRVQKRRNRVVKVTNILMARFEVFGYMEGGTP